MQTLNEIDIISQYNKKLKQLNIDMEVNINFKQQRQGQDGVDYRVKVSQKRTGRYLYTKIFIDYIDVVSYLKKITKKGAL